MIKMIFKYIFIIAFSLLPWTALGQQKSGKVISGEDGKGIGYVNIGIIGKNIGTVTDKDGNFRLSIQKADKNDSVRISMIGYESKTLHVDQFSDDSLKNISLKAVTYNIPQIDVVYRRPKILRIGSPVSTNDLRSGFSENDLGSELGIMVFLKKKVLLRDINLDVAICTYDSVIYRLNIYQVYGQNDYRNILKEPVYISFTRRDIDKPLTFDIISYSIIAQGSVLITLELFKDLGEGSLLFRTQYFTGLTYHRKTSQGNWTRSPGAIGMHLNTIVLN